MLKATPESYTILVRGIPKEYQTSEKLRAKFEEMYPGKVRAAHVAENLTALRKALLERDQVRTWSRTLVRVDAVHTDGQQREYGLTQHLIVHECRQEQDWKV